MTSPAVQSAFESLVAAIRTELRAEFLAALGGESTPKKRGPSLAPKAAAKPRLKARPKGAKRTANEIDELIGLTLKFIKANPGSRTEQIAQGLGVSTKDLVLPIGKLFETKAIKSTGQRRGTKYTAK